MMAMNPALTPRERLGAVIAYLIDRRGWDARRVANFTHVSVSLVFEWRAGRVVPTTQQWRALKGIAREFHEYNQLFQEATDDQDRADELAKEERRRLAKHAPDTKINTSLGDKMRAAIQPALETPPRSAPDLRVVAQPKEETTVTASIPQPAPKRVYPPRPAGALTPENVLRREAWARDFFRSRPKACITGDDGLMEEMRKVFGIGIKPDAASRIRDEVQAEIAGRTPANAAQKQATPPPVRTAASSAKDVEEAAALIVETIANLKTFTITVEPDGTYNVSYTTRETRVVEETNTLKGSRK